MFLFHYSLKLSITDAVFFTITNLHGEIGLTETLMRGGELTVASVAAVDERPLPEEEEVLVALLARVGTALVSPVTSSFQERSKNFIAICTYKGDDPPRGSAGPGSPRAT